MLTLVDKGKDIFEKKINTYAPQVRLGETQRLNFVPDEHWPVTRCAIERNIATNYNGRVRPLCASDLQRIFQAIALNVTMHQVARATQLSIFTGKLSLSVESGQ